MYYLNDMHPKKEYAIYKRVNNATPYIAAILSDLKQVDEYIGSVSRRHEHYRQTYYIDRNGFKNHFPKEVVQYYYKVLERPVNDWQEVA